MEGLVRSLRRGVSVALVCGLLAPVVASASLRVGNAELQVFYSQQHAFQYDDNTYGIDWVQFRNELSAKFTYERLAENGLLFEQLSVPFLKRADFFAYYRGRFDPVYLIRKRYRRILDDEARQNFVVPENEFREFFLDANVGEVGPGELSMRFGRQQIVWGESDLFRSLDIINPLRIDQSSLVGERFDDYRTPLWFAKFLYTLGTVGPISDIGIEPFYTANWQPILSDALLPGAFRLYDNDLPRASSIPGLPRGSSATSTGLAFVRPGARFDKNFQRTSVPWAAARQGSNHAHHAPAFVCAFSYNCAGQFRGERVGGYFNFEYDQGGLAHAPHGWGLEKSMAGLRILAKTGFGVDFSLNYLFKRAENLVYLDAEELLDRDASLATIGVVGPGRGALIPQSRRVYGAGIPGQDIYTGIARCTGSIKPLRNLPGAPVGVFQSDLPGSTRKAAGERIGNKGKQESAVLVGADLNSFNANNNPNDDVGVGADTLLRILGLPGLSLPGSPLIPVTACGKILVKYPWTHVGAFTATYNDFDYTGAIFRLEQSISTKEGRFKAPLIFRRVADIANLPAQHVREAFENNWTTYTPVYRSMIGFDLIRSLSSFPLMGWAKHAPLDMGTQITFITAQFLTEYQFDNFSNNFPSSFICTGFELQNKCNRWNMAATIAMAGGGYGKGKFEPLLALGHDFNVDANLILFRMFWHQLFVKNLDFYGGTVAYMGSVNQGSWLLLNKFADKDVLFLRLIYYLI